MDSMLIKMYDKYDRDLYFWFCPPGPVPKRRRLKKVEVAPRPLPMKSRWMRVFNFVKCFYKGL